MSPPKILIIEDEKVIALDIANALRQFGFDNLTLAHNARKAREHFTSTHVDIAICDIHLGEDESGALLAEEIIRRYNSCIIFLTAFKDESTLKQASSVSYTGFLHKPFRTDELESLIKLCKHRTNDHGQRILLASNYTYDQQAMSLYHQGGPVKMSLKEQQLFHLLYLNLGRIVPYSIIEESIWEGESVNDQTRRQLYYRLKKKLDDLPIETLKNEGIIMQKSIT